MKDDRKKLALLIIRACHPECKTEAEALEKEKFVKGSLSFQENTDVLFEFIGHGLFLCCRNPNVRINHGEYKTDDILGLPITIGRILSVLSFKGLYFGRNSENFNIHKKGKTLIDSIPWPFTYNGQEVHLYTKDDAGEYIILERWWISLFRYLHNHEKRN